MQRFGNLAKSKETVSRTIYALLLFSLPDYISHRTEVKTSKINIASMLKMDVGQIKHSYYLQTYQVVKKLRFKSPILRRMVTIKMAENVMRSRTMEGICRKHCLSHGFPLTSQGVPRHYPYRASNPSNIEKVS